MTNLDLEALARTFDEDGFVELRGFLAGHALDTVKSRTVALMERLGGPSGDGPYPTVRKSLQQHDPWAFEFLHRGPHVPILEALLGEALAPASFGWFDKRPGEADRVAPHFDAVGSVGNRGATVWIALDAASQESGCLYYLRGSHKREFAARIGIDVSAYRADACALEAQPGDAFIHNSRTVHWSGRNRSSGPRRAVALFYWTQTAAAADETGAARAGVSA